VSVTVSVIVPLFCKLPRPPRFVTLSDPLSRPELVPTKLFVAAPDTPLIVNVIGALREVPIVPRRCGNPALDLDIGRGAVAGHRGRAGHAFRHRRRGAGNAIGDRNHRRAAHKRGLQSIGHGVDAPLSGPAENQTKGFLQRGVYQENRSNCS
jgi:hypothetical protein